MRNHTLRMKRNRIPFPLTSPLSPPPPPAAPVAESALFPYLLQREHRGSAPPPPPRQHSPRRPSGRPPSAPSSTGPPAGGEPSGPGCGWCCWASLAKSGCYCAAGAPATTHRGRRTSQRAEIWVCPWHTHTHTHTQQQAVWQHTQSLTSSVN